MSMGVVRSGAKWLCGGGGLMKELRSTAFLFVLRSFLQGMDYRSETAKHQQVPRNLLREFSCSRRRMARVSNRRNIVNK